MTTSASPPVDDGEGGALPPPAEPHPEQAMPPARSRARRGGAAAVLVALGILLSKLFGLLRTRVQAGYLGTSDAADVFTAATRIPNLLQNLFGEGVLSASFIPVYARLLAEGDEREADRVAGAVFGMLAVIVTVLVAVGVLATPLVVDTVAGGFEGAKRDLTVRLVRILFPGTGLLVLSAWCLGVLNSHRRFFLSYAAPVVWNLAIIGALVVGGSWRDLGSERLVEFVAWWTVVGSALQFAVQLPAVLRALGRFRPSLDRTSAHARTVVRNFLPVFVGRGAVQISAFVDLRYASSLPAGASAALGYAQALYLLPVALFGMAISASELPAMSGEIGSQAEVHAALCRRLTAGLRRIAFFVIPSAVAFLALGDVVAATIYQSGAFSRATSVYVWAVLAGSAVGLFAATQARLYVSALYALKDTRTPLRFAIVRIALSVTLGWLLAFPLPRALGIDPRWGVAGLTAASGLAGWVEFVLLRRALEARIGRSGLPARATMVLWGAALVAAAAAWLVKLGVGPRQPIVVGVLVLGTFAGVYLLAALGLRVPEARSLVDRVLGRLRRGATR